MWRQSYVRTKLLLSTQIGKSKFFFFPKLVPDVAQQAGAAAGGPALLLRPSHSLLPPPLPLPRRLASVTAATASNGVLSVWFTRDFWSGSSSPGAHMLSSRTPDMSLCSSSRLSLELFEFGGSSGKRASVFTFATLALRLCLRVFRPPFQDYLSRPFRRRPPRWRPY